MFCSLRNFLGNQLCVGEKGVIIRFTLCESNN